MIVRTKYINQIKEKLNSTNRVIFLIGARDVGKTTILKQIHWDDEIHFKKIYFSFDDSIVSKQFEDVSDFVNYMKIKFGATFWSDELILLNEIQYSKNIYPILQNLSERSFFKAKIIATWGFVPWIEKNPQNENFEIIKVYPLSFFEFLEYKWIHTKYLNINNFSKIMLREVEILFDEFLMRWWYPSVLEAKTATEKTEILKKILKKLFEKDAGFYFSRDELLLYQDFVEILAQDNGNSCKINTISKKIDCTNRLAQKYIDFLQNYSFIVNIPFWSKDNTREVHSSKLIYFVDTGILNFLSNNQGSKLQNKNILKTFVLSEIIKNTNENIQTYKKINWSEIDFIIGDEKYSTYFC